MLRGYSEIVISRWVWDLLGTSSYRDFRVTAWKASKQNEKRWVYMGAYHLTAFENPWLVKTSFQSYSLLHMTDGFLSNLVQKAKVWRGNGRKNPSISQFPTETTA